MIVHNSYVKLHIKRHDWHFTFPKCLIVATSNTENLYAFRVNVLSYKWQIYFCVHLFTLFGDIIYYSRDSKARNIEIIMRGYFPVLKRIWNAYVCRAWSESVNYTV